MRFNIMTEQAASSSDHLVRRSVATACALGAALLMRSWGQGSLPWVLWLPAGMLVAAGLLLHRKFLGGQLLARAVFWANLLLGSVIAISGTASHDELGTAVGLALSCGMALLVLGRSGLQAGTSLVFRPVAFRASLTVALVMAMADAQSLVLWGGLGLERPGSDPHLAPTLLTCAAVMIVAIVGLYRIKLWGLVLNIAANIVIAALVVGGVVDLPRPIVFMLAATALIQVLLPTPLVVAFFTRTPPQQRTDKWRGLVVTASIVVLMAGALLAFLIASDIHS